MKMIGAGMRNMTEGSPAGHILLFALPLLLGSFLQQLYNMVDSWVVGNYVGDGALAAVGVGFPVMFVFTSLFLGLSNGATVVIAQFYGAGQHKRVHEAVDTIYTALLYGVLPLTAGAVALVGPLMTLLRVDPAATQEARLYLTIVCCGLIGSIGYNTNAGILNGLGNSGTTLLFLAVASVLNIVLDLVLVLWCGWGVAGVAVGTVASQTVSWLFGLFYINRRYPEIAIHPFCRRFDRELFRQVMHIGLPAGIQMSLVGLGAMCITSKVNSYGKAFTAGFNVGNKLDAMAFLPGQSLSSAVTAFVGQNTGAGKPLRVRQGIRAALAMTTAWAVVITVALLALRQPLMALFSPSPAVIDAGATYLQCVMPLYTLFAITFCLNNAMRGAGDSVFPMVATVASMFLRVPAVYLLANQFGPDVMYHGYGVGWAAGFLLTVGYYLTGRWKRHGSLAQPEA